jgi:Mce-associated membrane protein
MCLAVVVGGQHRDGRAGFGKAVGVDESDNVEYPDEETEDAYEGHAETPKPSRRRHWLRRVLAATAGIVFVAALGLSGFFGWQYKQHADTAAAGRAALAVAQSYAVTLTSIETDAIDQNFTQVLDGATGEFKDMYSQSASQLRQVLIDNKANSTGMVVDSAIKSVTKTKVEGVAIHRPNDQ